MPYRDLDDELGALLTALAEERPPLHLQNEEGEDQGHLPAGDRAGVLGGGGGPTSTVSMYCTQM